MLSFSLSRVKRTDLAFDEMLRTNLIANSFNDRSFSWGRNTEPSKARKSSTTKTSLGWGDLVDEDELVRDSPSLFQQGRIQRSNEMRTLDNHSEASTSNVRLGQTGKPSKNKVYDTFIIMSFLFSISSSTTVAVIAVSVAALGIQGGYNPHNSKIEPNRPTHILLSGATAIAILYFGMLVTALFLVGHFCALLSLLLTAIVSANLSPVLWYAIDRLFFLL